MGLLKLFARFFFSHVGLFLALLVYNVIGALLFRAIEGGGSWERAVNGSRRAAEIEHERRLLAERIQQLKRDYQPTRMSPYTAMSIVEGWINEYHSNLTAAVELYDYDGTVPAFVDHDWSFSSALLFAVSINTLIGYGHVTPVTEIGRFLVIPFAMLGVPLTLMFLGNLGVGLANLLRWLYLNVCCLACFSQRARNAHRANPSANRPKYVASASHVTAEVDGAGGAEELPAEIPILLMTAVLAVFVIVGGLLSLWWDDLPLATGVYVTFVSLTTVGFGDYVPGYSTTVTGSTWRKVELLLATLYVLLGLALLGMGISILVNQFVIKYRSIGRSLGVVEQFRDENGDGVDDNDEIVLQAYGRAIK